MIFDQIWAGFMVTLGRNLLFLALLASSAGASANVITLDFNAVDGPSILLRDPYFEDGFRVSSVVVQDRPDLFYQGHYDLVCGFSGANCPQLLPANPAYDGTPWLGTDNTSCRYFDSSGSLLGTGGCSNPVIRIDRFGAVFTPLDVVNVNGGWQLTSSRGGVLIPTAGQGTVEFTGDLWRDIEWLDFTLAFGNEGAPRGFDNLRVRVPEPDFLLLLSAGLVGVGLARRRRSIEA